jgi:peptidoglycan/xylan/chitin deacetylase (PgdA/CDA1 family)
MLGQLIISLDFELLWGVRDHADCASYGGNIIGAREAIPHILELFDSHGISATWATVGFAMCGSRDELMESLPPRDLWPSYDVGRLSSYAYLDDVGRDERQDPYFFGASLVERIQQTPHQEIGTHTLSHFYCLEPGQTQIQFEADLVAAIALAKRRKINLKSIVFPRNQYASAHLQICKRLGIKVYRGTPGQTIYRSTPNKDQTMLRRASRLLDAHTGMFGDTSFSLDIQDCTNVPASHFLRPCSGQLGKAHPLHLKMIKRNMTMAAKKGRVYHLWWHPHNFGQDIDANINGLKQILSHFTALHAEFGMESCHMAGAVK